MLAGSCEPGAWRSLGPIGETTLDWLGSMNVATPSEGQVAPLEGLAVRLVAVAGPRAAGPSSRNR